MFCSPKTLWKFRVVKLNNKRGDIVKKSACALNEETNIQNSGNRSEIIMSNINMDKDSFSKNGVLNLFRSQA